MENSLVKLVTTKKKRLGRGYGSKKGGHTCGRGAKGKKARSKVHPAFMGTKSKKSWIKRLPLLRGRGKMHAKTSSTVITLAWLENTFKAGSKVTSQKVQELLGLTSTKQPLKVVANGTLTKSITVLLPCSSQAKKAILAVGGKVLENDD